MERKKTARERKPGGRPQVAESERRSKTLGYSVTPKQYDEINQKAKSLKLTVSDYTLKMVLKGKIIDLYSEDEKQARRKLIGMSNNLNQLVVLAHRGGYQSIEKRAEEIISAIDEILDKS